MTCPHCRTAALSPDQRYCHACGALLAAPPTRYEGNAVGDGSARPLILPPLVALWISRQPGRLVLLGGGVALAVIVLAVVVVTLISAAIMALSALMPVIVFVAMISLAARPRRRRRYRHRYRSRGPVVWL
jgi:Flp pilus assembly protein TadB